MCGRRIHESYFQQSDYNDATCECDYYDALVARGSSVAGDVLSRKNRETKDRVPNRKIATGGRVRCPAPSGAAVTLLIDAFKPGLGAPASLVAALQLWAWSNAQYTVFSEGAARHFCVVGGAGPAIYQAGAALLTGGGLKEAAGDQVDELKCDIIECGRPL